MSFHLENINLIGKCCKGLLLYSPRTTQHNFLFFKILISPKFRVGDELCVSKMSFHLEIIDLIGKCYKSLLFSSPSTTQHKFPILEILFFLNSDFLIPLFKKIFLKLGVRHYSTTMQFVFATQ